MCDYSLHAVPNRLAVEGEELVTCRFLTGSMGLASSAQVDRRKYAITARTGFWQRMKQLLDPPPTECLTAVCIPPGARLRITDAPPRARKLGINPDAEVIFTQLTAAAYEYRDAIRFDDRREILLQRLNEGIRLKVISLTGEEIVPDYTRDPDQAPVL